jgi:hypothetical protein
MAAYMLLLLFGAKWGITPATRLEFMKKGDYQNPLMHEVKGLLYLGCGLGSWANEHYTTSIKDVSCCYLVAKELGLDRKVWGQFVDEVTREDRHGAGDVKNHLAQYIKDRYDLGDTFEQIYPWVEYAMIALTQSNWKPSNFSMSIHACYDAIALQHGEENADKWIAKANTVERTMKGEYIRAVKDLQEHPEYFVELETYKGTFKACIPSEVQTNPRITQAARSLGADLVLVRGKLDFNQIGIVIQTKQTSGLCLLEVLKTLRHHELMNRNELDEKKICECTGEGTLGICPYWHGHQAGTGKVMCTSIMSGAKTRPLADKTILDFDYICDLFKETIKQHPQGTVVAGFDTSSLIPGSIKIERVFQTQ